jgi:hypothetical protein
MTILPAVRGHVPARWRRRRRRHQTAPSGAPCGEPMPSFPNTSRSCHLTVRGLRNSWPPRPLKSGTRAVADPAPACSGPRCSSIAAAYSAPRGQEEVSQGRARSRRRPPRSGRPDRGSPDRQAQRSARSRRSASSGPCHPPIAGAGAARRRICSLGPATSRATEAGLAQRPPCSPPVRRASAHVDAPDLDRVASVAERLRFELSRVPVAFAG